jgi:P27 family predicted phage terminase small subunit
MPRPRKTESEHWLANTVPQYSDAPESTQGFRAGRPKMPKDLPPVAEAEWRRMCKQLLKRGTLTAVDSSALEIYVRMFARWVKVAAMAEEEPLVETEWTDSAGAVHKKVVENPASKIAARLEISLRNYQKEFAATPASRDKAKRAAPPVTDKHEPEPGTFDWFEKHKASLYSAPPPAAEPPAPPAPEQEDESLTNFEV